MKGSDLLIFPEPAEPVPAHKGTPETGAKGTTLLSTYYVPGTLILTTPLGNRYDYLCFIGEETETQMDEVICPKSQSFSLVESRIQTQVSLTTKFILCLLFLTVSLGK